MDLLNGKIKSLYFRYLSAAFGSALISCIYGVVDMAMVGQYQGPEGSAALAVVSPLWNVIYSLGLLMGIGGSVIFSAKRGGQGKSNENQYFTAAVVGSVVLAWVGLLLFERPLLTFFGADESLLGIAQTYMRPVKIIFPLFLFNQMLAAFLRNDGNPGLATLGVLSGGIFNIFGDYFFVFPCGMGVYGAGLATAISASAREERPYPWLHSRSSPMASTTSAPFLGQWAMRRKPMGAPPSSQIMRKGPFWLNSGVSRGNRAS